MVESVNLHTWIGGIVGLGLLILASALRRVYFSNISHIPGPRLAAISYFYQFYHDHGRWIFHQKHLHEVYGPIVRVGPDEVHIDDPDFYSTVLGSSTKRRDKSKLWFWFSGENEALGTTVFAALDHDAHRKQRAALNPFFSKAKVQLLESRIRGHALRLRSRLLQIAGTDACIDLLPLTSAMTLDIISEYSFGESTSVMSTEEMGQPMRKLLESQLTIHPFARLFPSVALTMMKISEPLTPYLARFSPAMREFDDLNNFLDTLTLSAYDAAVSKQGTHAAEDEAGKSIVGSLALNTSLPPAAKTYKRIRAEGLGLIGAGTEGTSRVLSVGLFHILRDHSIHSRLLEELRTVMSSPSCELPTSAELQRLPYLTAVIQESLRCGHGVAGRLVRIAPDEDIDYHGYKIPSGTTFAVSQYIHHMNPEIFPEPHKFIPDRYLGPKGAETIRYLAPFGKGPRTCLGQNLAWAEMYLAIAAVIGSLDLQLFDTTERDVTVVREYLIGLFPTDSKGIRVKVMGLLDH